MILCINQVAALL